MNNIKFYSFANITLVVGGKVITGFDEGDDAIQVSRLDDLAKYKVGCDGRMMVSLSMNKSGMFKFKLQQTSDDNAYLNALRIAQEAGTVFTGIPVLFQDSFRRDMAAGTYGFFPSQPALVRGANGQSMEWSLVVSDLSMLLGTK